MQTRLNLYDSAAVTIDRTAASAVPHRLLVFIANNTNVLKSPALMDTAKKVASTATTRSEQALTAATSEIVLTTVESSSSSQAATDAPATSSSSTPCVAAASALYVYKDTTLRSIIESLMESDPLTFLQALVNLAPPTTTTSDSNSDDTATTTTKLGLDNLLRYAYQVVLPASLAQEKTPNSYFGKSRFQGSNGGPGIKARRTENGVVTATSSEGAEETKTLLVEGGKGGATVTSSTGDVVQLDANGFVPALADAHARSNHPLFFLHHSLEDFSAAEALANSVSPTRRNRAILDALSILSVTCQNVSFGLSKRDFHLANEVLKKAGLIGSNNNAPHQKDDDAEKKENEEGKDSEHNAGDEKNAAEEDAEEDRAEEVTSTSRVFLAFADYLARASVPESKAKAIYKIFTGAKAEVKAILAATGNSLQVSHVFPDVNREANSAPIHKIVFCPENQRVGGIFNLPRISTVDDSIVAALATVIAGRNVLLHDRDRTVNNAVRNQHHHHQHSHHHHHSSSFGGRGPRGAPFAVAPPAAAAANNNNTAKAIPLSELMNPQGFDFRFGDALIITPAAASQERK